MAFLDRSLEGLSGSITGKDSGADIIGSCTKQTPCAELHVSIGYSLFSIPTYSGAIAHARSSVSPSRPPRQALDRLRDPSPQSPTAIGTTEAVGLPRRIRASHCWSGGPARQRSRLIHRKAIK